MLKQFKQALRRSIKGANLQLQVAVGRGIFESDDQDFRKLFPPQAKLRRVAGGFGFTEGPIWLPGEHVLLFSDIPGNRIYRLDEKNRLSVFRESSHHSNGLTLDNVGRLIACEHGARRVTRTELDGSITVLADSFEGKPLNSPNDVVVSRDGSIYFTDPPYGIRPEQQEQPHQGLYRIDPEGELQLLSTHLDRPNGLCFSRDERTLYVDDSSARCHIRTFEVAADGSLSDQGPWLEMAQAGLKGDPDGMKLDAEGRLYCTGPGGVWVISESGTRLGLIRLPELPANLAWGDDDGKGLYITARTSVYHLRTETGGAAPVWK